MTGGLDLSMPNVIAFSGVLLTGLSLGENGRLPMATLVVVAAGGGVGLINGLGVVKLRISPVIMTLATNMILLGVILVFTGGTPRGSTPPLVSRFTQMSIGPIPSSVVFLVVFAALCVVFMNATVFGRYLYAVGANTEAARFSGVPVQAVIVGAYVTSGLAAALTGVLLVAHGGSSYLGMGDAYLLLSIGAVIIGGASIVGGRGHYLGTLGAAILLTMITVFLAATTIPSAARRGGLRSDHHGRRTVREGISLGPRLAIDRSRPGNAAAHPIVMRKRIPRGATHFRRRNVREKTGRGVLLWQPRSCRALIVHARLVRTGP